MRSLGRSSRVAWWAAAALVAAACGADNVPTALDQTCETVCARCGAGSGCVEGCTQLYEDASAACLDCLRGASCSPGPSENCAAACTPRARPDGGVPPPDGPLPTPKDSCIEAWLCAASCGDDDLCFTNCTGFMCDESYNALGAYLDCRVAALPKEGTGACSPVCPQVANCEEAAACFACIEQMCGALFDACVATTCTTGAGACSALDGCIEQECGPIEIEVDYWHCVGGCWDAASAGARQQLIELNDCYDVAFGDFVCRGACWDECAEDPATSACRECLFPPCEQPICNCFPESPSCE